MRTITNCTLMRAAALLATAWALGACSDDGDTTAADAGGDAVGDVAPDTVDDVGGSDAADDVAPDTLGDVGGSDADEDSDDVDGGGAEYIRPIARYEGVIALSSYTDEYVIGVSASCLNTYEIDETEIDGESRTIFEELTDVDEANALPRTDFTSTTGFARSAIDAEGDGWFVVENGVVEFNLQTGGTIQTLDLRIEGATDDVEYEVYGTPEGNILVQPVRFVSGGTTVLLASDGSVIDDDVDDYGGRLFEEIEATPDGTVFAVLAPGGVAVLDTETGELGDLLLEGFGGFKLGVADDDVLGVFAQQDGRFYLIDSTTKTVETNVAADPVGDVDFISLSRVKFRGTTAYYLYSAIGDEFIPLTLAAIDLETGDVIYNVPNVLGDEGEYAGVDLSLDGSLVFVGRGDAVVALETATGRLAWTAQTEFEFDDLFVDARGWIHTSEEQLVGCQDALAYELTDGAD